MPLWLFERRIGYEKEGVFASLLALSLMLAAAGTAYAYGASGKADFSDVDRNDWYYPYLEKAVADKIAEGYGDGSFRPAKTVSYGEFITMAVLRQESREYKEGRYKGLMWSSDMINTLGRGGSENVIIRFTARYADGGDLVMDVPIVFDQRDGLFWQKHRYF